MMGADDTLRAMFDLSADEFSRQMEIESAFEMMMMEAFILSDEAKAILSERRENFPIEWPEWTDTEVFRWPSECGTMVLYFFRQLTNYRLAEYVDRFGYSRFW